MASRIQAAPRPLLSDEQTCRGCSLYRDSLDTLDEAVARTRPSLQRAPSPPPTHPGRTRRFLNSIYFARSFSFVRSFARSPRVFPRFPSDFLPLRPLPWDAACSCISLSLSPSLSLSLCLFLCLGLPAGNNTSENLQREELGQIINLEIKLGYYSTLVGS